MSAAEVIPFENPRDPREIIARHIEQGYSPDPHVIADRVIGELSDEALRTVAEKALPEYVAAMMRASRKSAGVRSHSSKWANVGEAVRDGSVDLFKQSICTKGREWKFLGDCTRDDILSAADRRRELAKANGVEAAKFAALAKLMQERGVQLVSDLPPMTVRAVLNA